MRAASSEQRSRRLSRLWLLALFLVLAGVGAGSAQAQLSITPTTWNVVGLDSNKVADGPNVFPVGARVCNTSGAALNNVTANFVWDSSNAFINLTDGNTLSTRSLAAGACVDYYFNVTITRSNSSYGTARRFHITVSADGTGTFSTPTPRELYVEGLNSQARNDIRSISGPTTVYVGHTYQYMVNAETAPGGYEQLAAFLHLSNIIFQVTGVSTTYSTPAGATNNKVYADACGWNPVPGTATYLQCVGPTNYSGGKAGDQISTTYTVKVLSTGTTTITSVIYDKSGGSYHYNADFGVDTLSVTAIDPPVTLSKTASAATVVDGGTVTYTLTINNTSTQAVTINDFVDTLPTSPASATYVAGSSTFNNVAIGNPAISGAKLTWTGLFVVPAGTTRALKFQATLPATSGTYVNSAVAHLEYSQIDTTSSIADNSPATASVQVVPPPDLTIAKTHTGNFTQGQSNASYTITVTNSGGSPTAGTVTVTDTLPAAFSNISASGTNWTCGVSGQTVTCTSSAVVAAGGSFAAITITANVSATAPASVTNTASVSGGGETNTGNNSSSDATTINQIADMTIAKTHTGNFTRGSTGTYSITATNSGAGATSGAVTVSDTLPAGLTPTGWSSTPTSGWSCNINLQVVTCTNSNVISAGASYPAISITVSVAQNAASSLTNTATVSGGGQAVTSNDSSSDATTIVSSSDLSLTKATTSPGSGVGTNATFTITVTNNGPTNATGVAVRDQLPAGLTYVSSTPSVGSYNSGTGVWTVGGLASGSSATLQLVARVDALGAITNTAQVSAANEPDPDSTPDNGVASEDDQASSSLSTSPPSVSLCKTILGQACPPPAITGLPGADLVYVITFTNAGGSSASSFVITDPIPSNTDFKVGSVTSSLGTTGLTVTVAYSNNGGATWVYVPASGGGSAPAGYDRNVTHVRWSFGGNLSQTAPDNTGNVGFTVRIR